MPVSRYTCLAIQAHMSLCMVWLALRLMRVRLHALVCVCVCESESVHGVTG